jgi:hypothetical protein
LPYKRNPLALVGARGSSEVLQAVRERLSALGGTLHGWRVDESVPLSRERTWPLGEPAPGACLLTFFRQNPKLTREQFFHEWYERHTQRPPARVSRGTSP